MSIANMIYWMDCCRIIACMAHLFLILLLIGIVIMIFMSLDTHTDEQARVYCHRYLAAAVLCLVLDICIVVFVPSSRNIAYMARQRILEGNIRVDESMMRYIDDVIQSK